MGQIIIKHKPNLLRTIFTTGVYGLLILVAGVMIFLKSHEENNLNPTSITFSLLISSLGLWSIKEHHNSNYGYEIQKDRITFIHVELN